MKIKKTILCLVISFCLASLMSCSQNSKASQERDERFLISAKVSGLYQSGKIYEGMSQEEVEKLCGEPTGHRRGAFQGSVVWEYGDLVEIVIEYPGTVYHIYDTYATLY